MSDDRAWSRDELAAAGVSYPYPGAEDAEAYEWLNICSDPDQRVEAAIEALCPIEGSDLLDIGAGSGFHALRYAQQGARVCAVEPDPRLRQQASARLAQAAPCAVRVMAGDAENIPANDDTFDLAIARFAYYFGTEACLPGIAEARRVLRPGGQLFVIDNDPSFGEMGAYARRAYPQVFGSDDAANDYATSHEAFFRGQGFDALPVKTVFRAPSRDVMAIVFQMDFPHCWRQIMAEVASLELDYGLVVYRLING